jgi:hypothetical protein
VSKPKKLMPLIVSGGPEPEFADIDLAQKNLIGFVAGVSLSRDDWKIIERARRDFHWSRWAKSEAIEHKNFGRRLKELSKALQKVSTSFGGQETDERLFVLDKTGLLLWHELSRGKNSFQSQFDVVAMVGQLRRAASAAISRTNLTSQKDAWQHDWDGFVSMLASVFENHRIRPTSTNTSNASRRKDSAFVSFVFEIVKSLPEGARGHTHSSGAMAKAISISLARRRLRNAAGRIASST